MRVNDPDRQVEKNQENGRENLYRSECQHIVLHKQESLSSQATNYRISQNNREWARRYIEVHGAGQPNAQQQKKDSHKMRRGAAPDSRVSRQSKNEAHRI